MEPEVRDRVVDDLSTAMMVVIFGPTFVVATMVVMNSGAHLNFTMIIATYTLVHLPALYCFGIYYHTQNKSS